MKPEDKVKYLLSEFSKEKALDICETMLVYEAEFGSHSSVAFWRKVKKLLKKRSNEA